MATIRSLIQSGDLPVVTKELGEQKCNEFLRAVCHGPDNKFRQVADLFSRDIETDIGLGIHFMHGLIGNADSGGLTAVYAVSRMHEIAILDLTKITTHALMSLTIQQIVDYILGTPPRCSILVHLSSSNERMHKVMKRLATAELESRHRRIVFCLTRDESTLPTGINRKYFPGTIDDRISMLLYLVPDEYADPDRLRAIAEKLLDYTVFQPKIMRHIHKGSIEQYFSSLQYHVVRRAGLHADDTLDDFPSFEVPWRKSLSVCLQQTLVPSPAMTSVRIHRVFPVGVSPVEAIQCLQTALPADLTSPYVLTVEATASEEKCGSIAITQETKHIVIHMNCTVDPGVMTEVCRELRIGHRAVVHELARTRLDTDTKLAALHTEICTIKELLKADRKRPRVENVRVEICKKKTCLNPVTERFGNGLFKKQCAPCNQRSNARK
jgi:hypothetical protein